MHHDLLMELLRIGLLQPLPGIEGTAQRYSLAGDDLPALEAQFLARRAPPALSFVARSGTGKTTFLEKLIPALRAHGLRLGVLKHHDHPTSFDRPGKDTDRHARAGAEVVVGISPAQVAVFQQISSPESLDLLLARHFAGLDLVLVEGYKRGPFPKIEIYRAALGQPLLSEPTALLALVTDTPFPHPLPQFGLEESEAVADHLLAWLSQ